MIPQRPIQVELNQLPTKDEVMKANKADQLGKGSGHGWYSAELYKAAGPATLAAFHDTLNSLQEIEVMPHDFRDGTIVPLFKTRAVEQIVAITEEYLFSPLQERFSHVLSLTG